jgi:uncharacterized Fe-S center protein
MKKSIVYYGSARQARLDAKETLPAKLDLIIDKLNLRERVKKENVLIKMHTGNNIGYSTIHPLFVGKLVKAIKEGGGKPFIADVTWDVEGAETRGYTHEVVGCPIYPAASLNDQYFYAYEHPFKNIKTWKLAGLVRDASFLVDFSHVKGHPSCGFGAAFKNIALGCMVGETRSAMHDTCHFDPYFFKDKIADPAILKKIVEVCPHGAVVEDKHHPGELHLHMEQCNQCGRCLEVAPPGSLKIDPVNFEAFQEACAISASITLSTFEPGKSTFLNLATHMTPVCDCFGFTSMPIMPDVGIFGSDDIVAVDQAVLDLTANCPLYEDAVPTSMEVVTREGHPFSWIHGKYKNPYKVVEYGEKLGLGSRNYELVDVLPVEKISRAPMGYISAQ